MHVVFNFDNNSHCTPITIQFKSHGIRRRGLYAYKYYNIDHILTAVFVVYAIIFRSFDADRRPENNN